MGNPRANGERKSAILRDTGRFLALPYSVLESRAYLQLSHTAKSLLIAIARQYAGDNNGRLLTSVKCLSQWGWKSADVITRAKRELLAAGLIHETVKGRRPNRASWYAVTWYVLDRIPGYDPEAVATFCRSGYRDDYIPKNARLKPSDALGGKRIAPNRHQDDASVDRLTALSEL